VSEYNVSPLADLFQCMLSRTLHHMLVVLSCRIPVVCVLSIICPEWHIHASLSVADRSSSVGVQGVHFDIPVYVWSPKAPTNRFWRIMIDTSNPNPPLAMSAQLCTPKEKEKKVPPIESNWIHITPMMYHTRQRHWAVLLVCCFLCYPIQSLLRYYTHGGEPCCVRV